MCPTVVPITRLMRNFYRHSFQLTPQPCSWLHWDIPQRNHCQSARPAYLDHCFGNLNSQLCFLHTNYIATSCKTQPKQMYVWKCCWSQVRLSRLPFYKFQNSIGFRVLSPCDLPAVKIKSVYQKQSRWLVCKLSTWNCFLAAIRSSKVIRMSTGLWIPTSYVITVKSTFTVNHERILLSR